MDKLRGHDVIKVDGEFFYCDDMTPTAGNYRDCGFCGKADTPEGHDGCLGTLSGVMNACCGHGEDRSAYVQFSDGSRIAGEEAMKYIERSAMKVT